MLWLLTKGMFLEIINHNTSFYMSKKSHLIFILSILLIAVFTFRYALGFMGFVFLFAFSLSGLLLTIFGDALIVWFYSRKVRRTYILFMTMLALYNFAFWVHQNDQFRLMNAGIFFAGSFFYIAYDLFTELRKNNNAENQNLN